MSKRATVPATAPTAPRPAVPDYAALMARFDALTAKVEAVEAENAALKARKSTRATTPFNPDAITLSFQPAGTPYFTTARAGKAGCLKCGSTEGQTHKRGCQYRVAPEQMSEYPLCMLTGPGFKPFGIDEHGVPISRARMTARFFLAAYTDANVKAAQVIMRKHGAALRAAANVAGADKDGEA